jgi:hypothetical protein
MPAIASRRSAGLAVAVVCVVVVVGCGGGQSATSTPSTSTSTAEPTTTTIPPLTAEEVAWLDGLTKLKEELQKKKDKIAAASTGLTRPLMVLLGKTLGSCSRELARLGSPPSDRLQPVYALAKKACQQLGKAARCQATMASLSDASGGVVVGSPQERAWKRAGDCADAAEQKGVKLLEDAHAKGTEIQIIAAVGHD